MSKGPQKEGIDAEVSFRERVEFAVVWLAVHGMRLLPRGSARAVGAGIAAIAYHALGRLRGVGVRNLKLAFPEMPEGSGRGFCGRCTGVLAGCWRSSA
ncbi:hypothetical protein [Tunturiibacter empetritectus]|uniref:hypothetical protein n=1 Tax=Tunturiibacter empetritectus TaxID=3069691 RepID=UPI003D9B3533